MRSATPSSSYHSLARRRLTAAKRHSVLAVNRGKYMRSNSRNFMQSAYPPKSSHIPIITSSMSTAPITSHSVESGCQNMSNVTALHNLFGPTTTENSLFTNTEHKDHSVEAVRVLQNIFQRDRLPGGGGGTVPSITSVHSEMSQDLNNLIQASTDAIGGVTSTGPNTSQHCTMQQQAVSQSRLSSPGTHPETVVEVSNDSADESSNNNNMQGGSSISSINTGILRNSPLSEGGGTIGDTGSVCHMQVDTVTSLKDDKDDQASSLTNSPNTTGPISPADSTHSRGHVSSITSPPGSAESKAKSEGGESISSIKEEPQEDFPTKSSPLQYPPTSQDIINQLNSLSASGIPSIGNIQNLANSLSNSLRQQTDTVGLSEASLQDAHLSSLSLNLSESLASSLNLSVGTGLDGMITSTSPTSSQLNFGGGAISHHSAAGKLEFLNRLDPGNDKPSMLSMVGGSLQSRVPGAASSMSTSGIAGAAGQGTCFSIYTVFTFSALIFFIL